MNVLIMGNGFDLAHGLPTRYTDFLEFAKHCFVLVDKNKKLLFKKDFSYILSFNYTDTYETLYGNENTKYCYIHGKTQADASKTNMILGIDETLKDGEENKNFAFAKFKKYFQRIFYKTGSEYRDWIKRMKTYGHDIYIVGHSLGTTDHDTLREFFDIENSYVKITEDCAFNYQLLSICTEREISPPEFYFNQRFQPPLKRSAASSAAATTASAIAATSKVSTSETAHTNAPFKIIISRIRRIGEELGVNTSYACNAVLVFGIVEKRKKNGHKNPPNFGI